MQLWIGKLIKNNSWYKYFSAPHTFKFKIKYSWIKCFLNITKRVLVAANSFHSFAADGPWNCFGFDMPSLDYWTLEYYCTVAVAFGDRHFLYCNWIIMWLMVNRLVSVDCLTMFHYCHLRRQIYLLSLRNLRMNYLMLYYWIIVVGLASNSNCPCTAFRLLLTLVLQLFVVNWMTVIKGL